MPRRRCTRPKEIALQVLEALEDAGERYDGRTWLEFKQRDWKLGGKLEELSEHSDPGRLSDDTIAMLARGEVELEYILQLLDAIRLSASDLLKDCRSWLQPAAEKLSKSLSSLPDELLSMICKFATHDEQEGTRHAERLSHVSRRFRRIVLADRGSWTTPFLWYDTTKETVERWIGRASEDSDLHIVTNFNTRTSSSPFGTYDFLRTCLTFASRWRTFTLSCEWVYPEDFAAVRTLGAVGDMLGGLTYDRLTDDHRRWILPRLQELILIQEYHNRRTQELLWHRCSPGSFGRFMWDAPNLRVLRCTQYIPPPSFPLTSITRLELSIILIKSNFKQQIQELLNSLSSMKNIAEVDLGLTNHDGAHRGLEDELDFGLFFCEAVKTFRLKLEDFTLPYGARHLLRPLVKALQMPILEHLSLVITLRFGDFFNYGGGGFDDERIHELVNILIPNPDFHTLLSSLTIDLPFPEAREMLTTSSWAGDPTLLSIPLDKIPRVSSLEISAPCRVSFSREDVWSARADNSSLKELRLDGCTFMDSKYLQEMVQSLKDVDAWDTLESVVVRECESLDFESALEVVGRERLRFEGR